MRRIKKATKQGFFRKKRVFADVNEKKPLEKERIITAEGLRRKLKNTLNKK